MSGTPRDFQGELPRLVERHVMLGHVALSIWCPVAPEELIDQAIDAYAGETMAADDDAPGGSAPDFRPPYWADVWPSAIALGRRLVGMPLAGRRVLELGAGVGVPGLAAAQRGARVLITDREPVAIEVVRRSAVLNGLVVETAVLDWNVSQEDATVPQSDFDWIVGADLLYDRSHVEPLAGTLAALLRRGGRALIADPDRWYQGDFVAALEARGLGVRRQPTHFYWDRQARTVTLIEVGDTPSSSAPTPSSAPTR
ncbi:MAG: methyltransferase domain-containing protein [Candidatus Eiseniibacteriota bacterium]|jgi:predicted nicotinamide N-methyase